MYFLPNFPIIKRTILFLLFCQSFNKFLSFIRLIPTITSATHLKVTTPLTIIILFLVVSSH